MTVRTAAPAQITPAQAGIPARCIKAYLETLEAHRLSTHSILIERGGAVCFEHYWAPFTADTPHRMYSATKSLTSMAVGLLLQDGKIRLDDPIGLYFPDEIRLSSNEALHRQTIREMLTMTTARLPHLHWMQAKPADRVRFYFEDSADGSIEESIDCGTCEPGTNFRYDSNGTFILGALVERITGMKMIEFLRSRILARIGVSPEARILTCPGGHSWTDSGLLCTTRDLAKIGRFLANGGICDGEQLLDPDYIRAATAKQTDTNSLGIEDWNTYGYGYQIWRTYRDSWLFWGMGSQFMLCVPDKDLIFVSTGDNQGNPIDMRVLIKNFFDLIVDRMDEENTGEAPQKNSEASDYAALLQYAATLKLASARGEKSSPIEAQISGRTWHLAPNPMGIMRIRLDFTEDGGTLFYTNAQGDKELPFGRCENKFGDFPEEDYDDEIGTVPVPGHKYRCAASAAWTMPHKLFISVQIIDNYLGRLNINLGFKEDRLGIYMNKSAEAFLENYQGYASGTLICD
ncbi:MAG: serine hydrolase [Lachnospiraceae bacterium]|nr:serine hydrolase [Lachnospiraceae bacterium]